MGRTDVFADKISAWQSGFVSVTLLYYGKALKCTAFQGRGGAGQDAPSAKGDTAC